MRVTISAALAQLPALFAAVVGEASCPGDVCAGKHAPTWDDVGLLQHRRVDVLGAFPDAPGAGEEAPKHTGTEVFMMLPLDVLSPDQTINDPTGLEHHFDSLQSTGIRGFMVDVWWGLTEPTPKAYNFTGYRELFAKAKSRGWKVQVVSSFHQCGGNVGDSCWFPLPAFVREEKDVWYKDAEGADTQEYISLFADNVTIQGRTPLEMYSDWLEAFAAEFSDELGELITDVMVSMGPAGELRYPSYPLAHWQFCGIGEFQAYDKHALSSLERAAVAAGHPEWTSPPTPAEVGNYNSMGNETSFFTEGYSTDSGRFFLNWYFSALKQHGANILGIARKALGGKAHISGKVSGVHWWYDYPSHPAEATAGYYNTNGRNAYAELAEVFAGEGAILDFTCLEMTDHDNEEKCHSRPQQLVMQVIDATKSAGIGFSGENALPRYDEAAYSQMESYAKYTIAITYLRLSSSLMERKNLAKFADFVADVGEHGFSPDAPSRRLRRE